MFLGGTLTDQSEKMEGNPMADEIKGSGNKAQSESAGSGIGQEAHSGPAREQDKGVLVNDRVPSPPQGAGPLLGNIISTDKSPSFFALEFRLNAEKTTYPGKFVAVDSQAADGRRSLVLARVNDVHEVNPHEDALSSTLRNVLPFGTKYAGEGHSTVIYRVVECEPLEEAILDDEDKILEIRSVDSLPRAGAAVFEAGNELTVRALGLEADPGDGIHVGFAHGDPDIPIVLNRGIIQRHVFIGGGIGSGKSYTRGVLAEELNAWGVPQVNIDVNGELIEATEELGGANLVPGKGGFTLPVSALSSSDVIEAVPSINPGTNMETLLRFTHESLLKDVMSGRKTHFTVDELVGHIDACAVQLQMTDKRTVEPTKLRTQSLNRLDFLGKPFEWKSKLKPGVIININCRGRLLSDLRLITASVMRDLQNLAVNKQIPFVILSIDEFHLVAPKDEQTVTTQVLREIARIGRHYKLGLILTTQSPSDVDRSILKRLLTRFLHAIEPDQLDVLRGVFSDASEDLVRSLPKLPQGTCIITGAFETVKHATVVKIRERKTTHGGKTPDIWDEFAKAGWSSKRSDTISKKGGR